MMQFCINSFESVNTKTLMHSAICLFAHVLCFQGNKKELLLSLKDAMEAIEKTLANTELVDQETL